MNNICPKSKKCCKLNIPYTCNEFINKLINFVSQHKAIRMHLDNECKLMEFCNTLYINALSIFRDMNIQFKISDEPYNDLKVHTLKDLIKSDISVDIMTYYFIEELLSHNFLDQLTDNAYIRLIESINSILTSSGYYHYIKVNGDRYSVGDRYHVRQSERYATHLDGVTSCSYRDNS